MKNRRFLSDFIVLEAVIAILIVVAVIANVFAFPNYAIIAKFLGQETTVKKELDSTTDIDTDYFKKEYKTFNDLLKDEKAYGKKVQSEGSVLLKNVNLPLAKSGKITILGSGSSQEAFLLGGAGSGAINTKRATNLKAVFEAAGYTVNPTMWSFYTSGAGKCKRNNPSVGIGTVGEAPISSYGANEKNSFKQYNDAAIVVIGRSGSEGADLTRSTTEDSNKSMLELSDNEIDLLNLAVENFDKVVVVLNTLNPIEFGVLSTLNVSVLWVGAGGETGITAIPELLNGTVNPSGKTVDTYAADVFSAPAMQNFGDFTFANKSDFTASSSKYVNYAEGIYVGYKYYETRYADVVTGRAKVGNFDYQKEVVFPFGYGLSYTAFEYDDFKLTEHGEIITAEVTVKNAGEVAGKEAVELYMQSPYTQYDIENGVGKSAVQLVGFAKTGLIEAGKSETVTISFSKEVMRAYDANNAKTYILDAGDYYFAAGENSHSALNNILAAQGYKKSNGMTEDGNAALTAKITVAERKNYHNIGADGKKIENAFDNVNLAHYIKEVKTLTRNDWTGTFPKSYSNLTAPKTLVDDATPKFATEENATMPTTGADNGLTLASMRGVEYDDSHWNELLDQLTPAEMMELVGHAGYSTALCESVGKPYVSDKDGPAGLKASVLGGQTTFGYPTETVIASTWNVELASEFGSFVGEDSLFSKVSGWYAPAVNVHRTPFSGRNFEYFSEDVEQSGIFAAAVVKASQEKGVYCYVKHFALNDQETNRAGEMSFVNEQAMREIYLRPFELAVRNGGARGIMTSMNNVGPVWAGASKSLLTTALRNEWALTEWL